MDKLARPGNQEKMCKWNELFNNYYGKTKIW